MDMRAIQTLQPKDTADLYVVLRIPANVRHDGLQVGPAIQICSSNNGLKGLGGAINGGDVFLLGSRRNRRGRSIDGVSVPSGRSLGGIQQRAIVQKESDLPT